MEAVGTESLPRMEPGGRIVGAATVRARYTFVDSVTLAVRPSWSLMVKSGFQRGRDLPRGERGIEPRCPGSRSQALLFGALMDVCSTYTHVHTRTHKRTDTHSVRSLYATIQKLHSDHCSIF